MTHPRLAVLLLIVSGCGPAPSPDVPSTPDAPRAPSEVAPGPPHGAAPEQARVTTPAPRAPAGPTLTVAAVLVNAHNRVREKHCAPPVGWSPRLEQSAQAWADNLRDSGCRFAHSNTPDGENLAAGSSGSLDADGVVDLWYRESADYHFPDGGFSAKTGHFTQLVWRGTREIGCGRAQCNGNDLWVCQYGPAGNVEGQYAENVKPTTCSAR